MTNPNGDLRKLPKSGTTSSKRESSNLLFALSHGPVVHGEKIPEGERRVTSSFPGVFFLFVMGASVGRACGSTREMNLFCTMEF